MRQNTNAYYHSVIEDFRCFVVSPADLDPPDLLLVNGFAARVYAAAHGTALDLQVLWVGLSAVVSGYEAVQTLVGEAALGV